jgi:AcrR family transcriptional regulator
MPTSVNPTPDDDTRSRNRGRRVDSRATRERLLAAVGRLLDHGHEDLTLQAVAEEAGVSTATAYRYFGSAEDAIFTYTVGFPDAVGAAFAERDAGERGVERLALYASTWVRLVDEWGTPLVQLRSTDGFLARRAAGEQVIGAVCAHLEAPMAEALAALELDPELLPFALFLWNTIYDPREILDLRRTLRWTRTRIERTLLEALLGAIVRAGAPASTGERRRKEA